MRLTRGSYIPKGAIKVMPKNVNAEIYLYEREGKLFALAFSGRRNKPDFHYRYRSVATREQTITNYVKKLEEVKTWKEGVREKRKAFRHTFKVGDILHYSWDYDQTNREFYQVVGTTEHTVTIREIGQQSLEGSQGFMCDSRVAVRDKFIGEPIQKRVQPLASNAGGCVSMDHGIADLWDGRPQHCSWYA